jgi:hypothetical protein
MAAEAGLTLDDQFLAGLIKASAAIDAPSGRSATVAITIGKKQRAAFEIVDGQVTGPAAEPDSGDGEVEMGVTVPTTAKQLAALVDGSESMAQSYMRGDLKPVGATGAFLALVELFEDEAFRTELAAILST